MIMEQLNGAQQVVRVLEDLGVTKIFGYPGAAVTDIYDELYNSQKVEHILARHEQGAVHMADGFSRATGGVGVAIVTSGPGATNTVTGLGHLEGKTVLAMGDGYLFEPKTVSGGSITLEQPVKNVVVGLPYTMIMEQPNFNTNMNGLGNIQSMEQAVNNIVLRLSNSYGGMVGPDEYNLNEIIYEVNVMDLGEKRLFTGDKKIVMASGGFNKYGRTYIKHDKPYPFTVSAIIRAVTMGGPGI